MIRTTKVRHTLLTALLLGLLALALLAQGCGGGAAASPSPSPSPSASSVVQKLEALTAYVAQVTPLYNQASSAVGSLGGAVSGLSRKPDQTWADSGAQMTSAAAALGTTATSLAALTPPTALQGAQDNVVAALQAAQKVLDTTGSYLTKRVLDPNYPDIKTQITQQVTNALAAAWASVFSAAGQGPTPTPAP
jgi:hypothetical protein